MRFLKIVFYNLKNSLALSKKVTAQITQANDEQLESIKDEMTDKMEVPIGWHTMGIPLSSSFICSLFSCAMSLTPLGIKMIDNVNWPEYPTLTGVFITSFIYCLFLYISAFFIARGFYHAIKVYLAIYVFTTILASLNFLFNLVDIYQTRMLSAWLLIFSIVSILLIMLGIRSLNSKMFYQSVAYYLFARTWRKQLHRQK